MVIPHARAMQNGHFNFVFQPMHEFAPITLDDKTPFYELENTKQTQLHIDALAPTTRRLLDAVRLALTTRSDPAKGYAFRSFVTRAQIAARLGRASGLVPHDVRLLAELVQLKFVVIGRHPLKPKTFTGVDGKPKQLGAGWEYVYAVPKHILVALLLLADEQAFDQLRPAVTKVNATPQSSLGFGATLRSPEYHRAMGELQAQRDAENYLAMRNQGRDFETNTHIYRWVGDKHIKREKRGLRWAFKRLMDSI